MLSRRKMFIIVTAFAAAHCGILFAGFFAPYTPATQHREYAYAAPTKLHFVDVAGHVHIRPFVYPSVPVEGDGFQYREDPTSTYPIRLFSRNSDGTHLLSVDAPAHLFLFGTDGYGRDIFSRVLFGGRVSLLAASVATVLSLLIGVVLGGVAGQFGGLSDTLVMRGSELILALPWIYLLLALRASLPLHVDPTKTLILLSVVVGAMGWARPARLIRGIGVVSIAVSCASSDPGHHHYTSRGSNSTIHCSRSHAVFSWTRDWGAHSQLGKHALGISAVPNCELLLVDGGSAGGPGHSINHILCPR